MDNSAFMENLRQLFGECDVDKNGCLNRDEFSQLCAKIGLNRDAAHETFARLDIDRDDKITFDEFAAGFDQYSRQSPTNTSLAKPVVEQQGKKSPSPVSTLARKSASPVGVLSLGGGSSSSSSNLLAATSSAKTTISSSSADQPDGSVDSSFYSSASPLVTSQEPSSNSMVVYSSEAAGGSADYYGDQPPSQSGSLQFSSLLGGGGGGGSLNGASSGSFSQVRNMQDLLDCVQKLQSENQILTQIFFKDKREREEYISQLGEEFDQQVREVEERANRRAREELENEKKRLREMMHTERETLQHHYKTIEKMSKLIQTPQGSKSASDLLVEGEGGIDTVKTKLEETYLENRQLKRSLLDTKTDVAMIWKEMEKLKRQYEDKLSSAYLKNDETRNECDHIKQQLNLMKDSNRKLQDASDVITTYIADKVEPVIKAAGDSSSSEQQQQQYLSPNGSNSLAAPGGSQPNSRRGSVLSEYLNSHPDSSIDDDDDGDDEDDAEAAVATGGRLMKQNLLLEAKLKQQHEQRSRTTKLGKLDPDLEYDRTTLTTTNSSTSSSSGGGGATLPQINLPGQDQPADGPRESSIKKSCSLADAIAANENRAEDSSNKTTPEGQDSGKQARAKLQTSASQLELSNSKSKSLKSLGRHFFLGSKDKLSSAQEATAPTKQVESLAKTTKSLSLDQRDALEPLVEPADGPSVATFNIILVGDSFVGKSSFAARFMEGSFVQGLISNCSIDFKTKTYKVDGINYTVNLWDTAGQERFRSITASYFRKADGIILMYDVTDKRSYLNVRNWMSTISDTAAENVAVLLVGNKIDLRDANKTGGKADKCVPHAEGFRLAKEYDIVFLETSVKTGANLIPSMGRLIRLIAKNNSPEEKDDDTIRLNDKNRTFHCMPKNC